LVLLINKLAEMKPYLTLVAILLIGFVISCKKDSLTNDLKGQWVRVDNRTDTLTFGISNQDNWFELFRGYEADNDGILRPVIPLGVYEYKIKDNTIQIHWSASSSSIWPEYYFSFQGSEIEMGNFIDSTSPRIIFEKVK
jgi:hypothetical protein